MDENKMDDKMKEKQLAALILEKHRKIGLVIVPSDETLDSGDSLRLFMEVVAGNAALCGALDSTVAALAESALIPQDLSKGLREAIRDLSTNIQKAMVAQRTLDAEEWRRQNSPSTRTVQ